MWLGFVRLKQRIRGAALAAGEAYRVAGDTKVSALQMG